MNASEKVAYLRGLLEGLEIDLDSKEGKLYSAIIEVLDELASDVTDMQENQNYLEEKTDEIDHDLGELEEFVFDGGHAGHDHDHCECGCEDEDDDDELLSEDFYESQCPSCGETIYFDEDLIKMDEITCPNCGIRMKIQDAEE